jgi:hypothetical protein
VPAGTVRHPEAGRPGVVRGCAAGPRQRIPVPSAVVPVQVIPAVVVLAVTTVPAVVPITGVIPRIGCVGPVGGPVPRRRV